MSSYQQISIGIPNALHPYTQNLPDEPESDPSQLQAPLLETAQQHDTAQNPSSSNHQAPTDQLDHNQTSNQPAQGVELVNRRELEEKIQDVEKRLNSIPYIGYKIWLYGSIFTSLLFGFGFTLFMIYSSAFNFSDSHERPLFGMTWIWITWCIWSLLQCVIMKNAMISKSFEGAKRGFRMMIGYAVYYLATFLAFLALDELRFFKTSPGRTHEIQLIRHDFEVYMFCLIIFYVPPMFINLFGANRVISLLAKREKLVLEVNNQSYTAANIA